MATAVWLDVVDELDVVVWLVALERIAEDDVVVALETVVLERVVEVAELEALVLETGEEDRLFVMLVVVLGGFVEVLAVLLEMDTGALLEEVVWRLPC